MKFVICTNPEILSDGTYIHAMSATLDVLAVERAAMRIATSVDGCDLDTDSFFSHWKGGKYDQFYDRCGLVAYPQRSGPEVQAVAERLNDAMRAEIDAQDLAEQMDDCEHYAQAFARDESDLEWFLEQVAPDLIPARTGNDKESIIEALRVRLAERK
jgi:hypothetical protein